MGRLALRVVIGLLIVSVITPAQAFGSSAPRDSMFYVVMAHPDDEIASWSMIENLPDSTYVVFVTFTRGESTISCLTASESRDTKAIGEDAMFVEGFTGTSPSDTKTGPYKYQGPDSPVTPKQPDQGERHPLGDPWVGQGSDACGDARIASWHWFLDDMHALDGSGTSFEVEEDPWLDDDFQGRFCPPGHQGQGDGRPIEKRIGCADVWADDFGARITFEFPNALYLIDPETNEGFFEPATFGVEEVTAAIATMRANRPEWGLSTLPESGMLSAMPNTGHPEHKIVAEALFEVDHGAGPQFGPSIDPSDPYFQAAEQQVVHPENWATVVGYNLINPVTEERLGPMVVNYGWLEPTYTFRDSNQLYWKVFG